MKGALVDMDWYEFLRNLSRDTLASPLGADLQADVRDAAWLGFPPATDEQISQTEARLGIALPPSYRAFLKVSNGWRKTGHFIDRVYGVEEIDWFRTKNREWVKAFTGPSRYGPREEAPDEEYFAYEHLVETFRTAHLKETLQISEVGDVAVYLLNPQVIDSEGEWEAWFFANWVPGAHRYRSFAEMMHAEYAQFAGTGWKQPRGIINGLPNEYLGSPGSPKRKIKKRRRPRERKILGKPISKWNVDELLGFLANPEYDIIHSEVIEGLGLLSSDARAVEALLAMLHQNDARVIDAAEALKRFAPERVREALLKRLQQSGVNPLIHSYSAILAELGEERAVPILVNLLRDEGQDVQWVAECVGQHLAAFGDVGFQALVRLAREPQAYVRRRAAAGLCYTNRPEARDVFETLLDDPDPFIREQAQISLQVLPPRRPG